MLPVVVPRNIKKWVRKWRDRDVHKAVSFHRYSPPSFEPLRENLETRNWKLGKLEIGIVRCEMPN